MPRLVRIAVTPREPRQRWRVTFSRGVEARLVAHADAARLWESALLAAGLPIAMTGGATPKARFVFAAPLPVGMDGERELADLFLTERLPLRDLRERLAPAVPTGYGLVDAHDVWIGEPSAASRLTGADYEVELVGAARRTMDAAIGRFIESEVIPRQRVRDAGAGASNLRPLVAELELRAWRESPDGRNGGVLWTRLRHDPALGSARPDEVVAALARLGPVDETGLELEITRSTRLRLWLSGGSGGETP
jgi:radical SAM-linked protein